jgi:hypothetical protein
LNTISDEFQDINKKARESRELKKEVFSRQVLDDFVAQLEEKLEDATSLTGPLIKQIGNEYFEKSKERVSNDPELQNDEQFLKRLYHVRLKILVYRIILM